ncbi:hypothetical protein B7494_g7476 [Chlorociboria aeruginascens]|nr:hypothetical protein B7494_g7476 [Chlorociboria aeruginascens]
MMVKEKRGSQYIAHAGAATELIKVRGPKAVCTAFETNLLRSQYGRIIMEAFLRREECFLVRDGWQAINFEGVQKFGSAMLNQLLRIFSRIPSLIKHVRSWHAGSTILTMDQLIEYINSLQGELSSILTTALVEQTPNDDLVFKKIPSLTDDSIYSESLRFRTAEGAIFHTWRWTAVLIVNLCMANLLRGDALRPEIANAAQHICMSCEYAATLRPLGAQFLQLPLIVTYSVSSEQVKHWILRKINLLVEEMHISFERGYLETIAALVVGNLD